MLTACGAVVIGLMCGTGQPVAPVHVAAPVAKPLAAESDRTQAARLQTRLARAGFSPGLIDGKPGRKTQLALKQFQEARGLAHGPEGAPPDAQTVAALLTTSGLSGEQWTRAYTVSDADVGLVTGAIPTDWHERAALTVSGYADLQELLAERGWCSVDLVAWLNPALSMGELKAGDVVTLPDVPDPLGSKTKPAQGLPPLARVEVDLNEKLVKGYDEAGVQVALIHCSIAAHVEKRPVGELHVKVIAMDPEYTFDPKDWPEVEGVGTKLRIAPGPRNPVGAAWIGLDKPGYGMHGTVRPQDIGKSGSHGCFRLCNWDAVRLAWAVKVGTVVEVKE